MNILIFSVDYKPLIGGMATYTYEIAKNFYKHKNKVIVLAPKFRNSKKFDEKQKFKTYRVTNKPFIKEFLFFIYLIYLKRKYKIDIVYNVMWYPCGFLCYFLSKFMKLKYITCAMAVEILDSDRTLTKRIKKKLKFLRVNIFNNSFKIIAISHYTKNKLIKQGVNENKVLFIPPGVNLEDFRTKEKADDIIKKYNLKNKKIILTISRLDDYKGHDMVIKSLPNVLKKIPNAVYLIGGNGYYLINLKRLVKKLNLEDKVIFLGTLEGKIIPKLYNSCDAFILASREIIERPDVEGFGIVFLEASASKKPVIGGNSGGIPDAVADNTSGYLVNPEDPKDIANKLIKILSNKTLAKKLGENGYKRAKEKLTWDKITLYMLKIMKT